MNTEEKNAAHEAQQAEDEQSKASDEQSSVEGNESQENEDSKQLRAELEKERKAREKAEKAAAEKAYKYRESKREKPEDDDEDEGSKPLTKRELEDILQRERDRTRKELQSEKINNIVSDLSENPDERDLILEIHRNRNFPDHLSIQEQLEESYILANKKKILGENKELKRALRGRDTVNRDGSSAHQTPPGKGAPKINGADAAEFARLGFKWNESKRYYEKKLSNGDSLVKDPGSGQTRLVKG